MKEKNPWTPTVLAGRLSEYEPNRWTRLTARLTIWTGFGAALPLFVLFLIGTFGGWFPGLPWDTPLTHPGAHTLMLIGAGAGLGTGLLAHTRTGSFVVRTYSEVLQETPLWPYLRGAFWSFTATVIVFAAAIMLTYTPSMEPALPNWGKAAGVSGGLCAVMTCLAKKGLRERRKNGALMAARAQTAAAETSAAPSSMAHAPTPELT